MKRKRTKVKIKNQNVKTVCLQGVEVNSEANENKKSESYTNGISLNADQTKHIVNTLNAIEQRLQTSETVWKMFFHKLLELRTHLESQAGSTSTIKYEVKYDPQPIDCNSDSENTTRGEIVFPNLPILTVADFKHLNRTCCANPDIEQKLQNYFLNLPSEGLSLRKWCEMNLSLFVSDSVANHFSWNGSKVMPMIKEPVYNTKTIKILINSAKIKYESCVKFDIEQCIRWWFARASLRTTINHKP